MDLSETETKRLGIVQALIDDAVEAFGATRIVSRTAADVHAGLMSTANLAIGTDLVVLYDVLDLLSKPSDLLKMLVSGGVWAVIASVPVTDCDWTTGRLRDLFDEVGYNVTDHRQEGDWQVLLALS